MEKRLDGQVLWQGTILNLTTLTFVFQAIPHPACPCVPLCLCWVA